MQQLKTTIQSIVIALLIILGTSYVSAWTGPTVAPPGGNVAAPISVSNVLQVKQGPLHLGSSNPEVSFRTLAGKAAIGTADPIADTLKLLVRGKVGAEGYCDESGDNCVVSSVDNDTTINTNTTLISIINDPWDPETGMFTFKRVGIRQHQDDKVSWCPATHPHVIHCSTSDISAPAASRIDQVADFGQYCPNDQHCDTSPSNHTPPRERNSVGSDDVHLEIVRKSSGNYTRTMITGCLAYDQRHSHKDYNIDLICSR